MLINEFLSRIWPVPAADRVFFLVKSCQKRMSHHPFSEPWSAAATAAVWDAEGHTVYHACASYGAPFLRRPNKHKVYRTFDNVEQIRSMWLDLDVAGPGESTTKKYPDQRAALVGLSKMLTITELPSPSLLVSSGRGIHVYWVFIENVHPPTWKHIAEMLKGVCAKVGLLADPSRTADACSILRPIGTMNRKNGVVPVRLLRSGRDVDFRQFGILIGAAIKKLGIVLTSKPILGSYSNVNDDLIVHREFPPSSAHRIAKSCAQLRRIADTRGNIEEPLWYAGIGVLRHCVESPDIIHEWSNGHPGYSRNETDNKIRHHVNSGTGPTTCEKFRDLAPEVCIGCPFATKVKSPIQLGVIIQEAPPPVINSTSSMLLIAPATPFGEDIGPDLIKLGNPPFPWIRTPDGKLAIQGDDGPETWCEYDVYPTARYFDVHLRDTITTLRCHRMKDGAIDLPVPNRIIGKVDKLAETLHGIGVNVHGKGIHKMHAYLMDYMTHLQHLAKQQHCYSRLGWAQNFGAFVLGHSTHFADGSSVSNADGKHAVGIAGFTKRGSLNEWKKVMAAYSKEGMEAYQFVIGAAFGAPLMVFTGYEGALISLVSGKGGHGKSTVQEVMMSVWGDPREVTLKARDTELLIMQRIGAYNNIPVAVDEVSNLHSDKLSDLAYQVTQGRERRRLKQDATEREVADPWNTIVVVSTNNSIIGRLSAYKKNSDAELHRIIEYTVQNPGLLTKAEADELFPLIRENHGVAGDVYAKWMVRNVEMARAAVKAMRLKVDAIVGATTHERYWSAAVAAVLTGVSVANKLGLIDFDVPRLCQWTVRTILNMRTVRSEVSQDSGNILGTYLNEFMSNRVVVQRNAANGWTVLVDLKASQLIWRQEYDTGRAIIDKGHFRQWFIRNGGDYTSLIEALRSEEILIGETRRSLGHGTLYSSPTTDCFEINLNHQAISSEPNLRLVEPIKK